MSPNEGGERKHGMSVGKRPEAHGVVTAKRPVVQIRLVVFKAKGKSFTFTVVNNGDVVIMILLRVASTLGP